MPPFHEAKDEAANRLEVGAANAVNLIAADNPRRLETEVAVAASPLPYLPHFSKYAMVLNPPLGTAAE